MDPVGYHDFMSLVANARIVRPTTDGSLRCGAIVVGTALAPPRCIPFTQRCRRGWTRHSLTKAYHPWTNGLVERTGGTTKAQTVSRQQFDSTAMLDLALYGSERYFNEQRPYKVMGGKTTAQLTQEWYAKSPQRFLRQPVGAFTTW